MQLRDTISKDTQERNKHPVIQKKKFNVIGPWFRPDYYEEYKGYQFAVSLSLSGYRDLAILLPKGVHALNNYIIIDDEGHVERNWFYHLVTNKFKTLDYQGFPTSPANRQEFFVPVHIGYRDDENYITFVRTEDWDIVFNKYKDDINQLPEEEHRMLDDCRKAHAKLENAVDAEDSDLVKELVGPGVKIIYDFSQDDVINLAHEFIDELIKHDEAKANHDQILSKVKTNYENRRFKRYESKVIE